MGGSRLFWPRADVVIYGGIDVDSNNVGVGPAFIAGLVSFLSPCVLALVPAYVGYRGSLAVILG